MSKGFNPPQECHIYFRERTKKYKYEKWIKNKKEKKIKKSHCNPQDGHIDFREFMIVLYIMSNGSPGDKDETEYKKSYNLKR